ncbi:MAG: FtsW/RodA/SpoVE family cell cycle protein [Oscillospiraceae bacterium]|nr:FtsW/RodA/SpoVE family cell cycle protein [Oscillospiraceae bacterium]
MEKNPWLQEFIQQTDFILLGICATCSAVSVYSLYSIFMTMNALKDTRVVIVQMGASIIGIIAAVFISIVDYKELCEWHKIHMALCIALMILTAFIGYGPDGTSNKAWIELPGGMSLQPSELLKISTVITLGHYLNKYKDNINEIPTLIKLIGIALVPMAFVAFQRDTGTLIIYAFIIASMFFAAGISWKLIAFAGGAVVIGLPVAWFSGLIQDYQKNRVLAIFDPDNPEFAFIMGQQNDGRTSIGSGQLFGKGFMTDAHNNVPLPQNDFIFSFMAESVGFIGILLIIALLLGMCFRILIIGNRSGDMAGSFICVGIFAMLIFQTIVNVGMNLSVLPVIGITLPLFSAGGTSVLATYCAIGLALSVARHNKTNLF